jgi:hypothetical protein
MMSDPKRPRNATSAFQVYEPKRMRASSGASLVPAFLVGRGFCSKLAVPIREEAEKEEDVEEKHCLALTNGFGGFEAQFAEVVFSDFFRQSVQPSLTEFLNCPATSPGAGPCVPPHRRARAGGLAYGARTPARPPPCRPADRARPRRERPVRRQTTFVAQYIVETTVANATGLENGYPQNQI